MRKKVLEQEFIRLNADYKALLDETIQLREKVATADEALEKMRATEENVRSIHENTRRLKHDMRNHLMVIAMSLGNEKYDEARTYTAQILDKLNLEYSYIDSGNALLNYILNLKLQQAQQMQVHMQLQIENLKFQKIDSVDFSSLLTNLLDNAITPQQSRISGKFPYPSVKSADMKLCRYGTVSIPLFWQLTRICIPHMRNRKNMAWE